MDSSKYYFQKEIKHINEEIEVIKRINNLNSKLRDYNWLFIHPYNQGIVIENFEKIINEHEKEIAEEKIFEYYAKKFLTLTDTIVMIEGYYKKRPFLKDFKVQIEESVILCLQKDFSGAINLLLPVIEGSLRNYLISKRGDKAKTIIKMSDLSAKTFNEMTNDYVNLREYYYSEGSQELKYRNTSLDINQKKQLLKKHKEYFTLWINQLNEYLNNNLYLDTRISDSITDDFNRHNLIHALDTIDYSFKNYLRLFNCLNFLTWAFGNISKGCSILAEYEDKVIEKKWVEYFKILTISESMTEIKAEIYEYEIQSFKKYIDKTFLKPLAISEILHKQLLKVNDVFLKRKK